MKPLQAKYTFHGGEYLAVIQDPKPGAEVRIYRDGDWLGVGKVKKFPECKITGAVRKAYGETMRGVLRKLGKRLTKKATRRLERIAEKKRKKREARTKKD